ncbi:MAG: hypothetical protein Kow0031_27080 [Anaerolineae bacterium]
MPQYSDDFEGWTLSIDDGIAGAVIRTGRPELVNNAHLDPRSTYPPGEQFSEEHLMSFPFVIKDRPIGVLNVARFQPPRFTPEEFEFITLFTQHATIALHNAQLYTELQHKTAELSTLLESASAASSSLELETVLTLIAEQMVKAVGASACTLSRWHPENNCVETWVEWHRHQRPVEQPGAIYNLQHYPYTQRLLKNRQPLLVHATQADQYPAEVALMQHQHITTRLVLPLAAGDQVIGLVELDEDSRIRRYSPDEISLLQALASQAAIFIQNAQLFGETRRRLAEQTALREASSIISSTLDITTVLNHIAVQMGQLLDVTSTYIGTVHARRGMATVEAEYFGPDASPNECVSDLGESYNLTADFPVTLRHLLANRPLQVHVDDPASPQHEAQHLRKYGVYSALTIPLTVGGHVNAFVELWESRRHRTFTAEEISLAQAIAQHAAIALENARLYQQAQQEITERIIAEEQRTELEIQLYHAQKLEAVGQLAGGIAHDFNNLLTAIIGRAALARELLPEEHPVQEDIAVVEKSANRAAELTRQLLAFARRQAIAPTPITLNALILHLDAASPKRLPPGIALALHLAHDLHPVSIDPAQFEVILNHLITNACDAMPAGGKITISTRNVAAAAVPPHGSPDGDTHPFVQVTVADTGVGMSEAVIRRIFEPFFTTKEVGKGTGLGLSSCYGIVKQYGGLIEVQSQPNKGATFYIYLPAATSGEEPA